MVAITVILAAVIGAFVFGMADQIQTTTPNAQITITDIDTANDNVTIAHNGGDNFNEGNTEFINVTVAGDYAGTIGLPFTAGGEETIESESAISSGDTIRVVWIGQDRSVVIAQRQA